MNILVPSYYKEFKCIADQCRHNCCIGWEIDIDERALSKYFKMDGELGKRLKKSISLEDGPHFILDADERCPFLNKDSLCDIICEKGEDAICQICKDHPRYRNEFMHFEEMGLGLCCEEAARLILSQKEPVQWEILEKDSAFKVEEWESDFLKMRKEILAILQDRALPYSGRIAKLEKKFSLPQKSISEWKSILLQAEKMEPQLDEYLSCLMHDFHPDKKELELPIEQLSIYFINRHLHGALSDGLFFQRISMALGFSNIICAIANKRAKGYSLEILIDTARLFSAEIEYSDQNIDYILSKL